MIPHKLKILLVIIVHVSSFNLINKRLCDPAQVENTISHEAVHVDQIKRGDMHYDDKYVYWKGKKYLRSKLKEGDKKLPWEAEAYKKEKPIKKKR